MWLAQSYCDVDLGLFSTEEKAKAALVEYHGSEEAAEKFGHIHQYEVDTFEVYRDGQSRQMDYRDKAPTSPVQAPADKPLPNVARLPQTGQYTPAQALQLAMQEAPNLARLFIAGEYVVDGKNNGELYVLCSKMSMVEVVWLDRRVGAHIDKFC